MPPKVPIAVLSGVEMTISCMLLITCSFRECQLNYNGRSIASEIAVQDPASLLLDLKPHHITQRLHCTFDGPPRTVIEPHGGGPDKLRFPLNFAFLTSHTRFLRFRFLKRMC